MSSELPGEALVTRRGRRTMASRAPIPAGFQVASGRLYLDRTFLVPLRNGLGGYNDYERAGTDDDQTPPTISWVSHPGAGRRRASAGCVPSDDNAAEAAEAAEFVGGRIGGLVDPFGAVSASSHPPSSTRTGGLGDERGRGRGRRRTGRADDRGPAGRGRD